MIILFNFFSDIPIVRNIEERKLEDFENIISVNFKSVFYTLKVVLARYKYS
jgi:NAD(P)-dependent dehydrogenase (short-subunit alcohol dehydrogenase family)